MAAAAQSYLNKPSGRILSQTTARLTAKILGSEVALMVTLDDRGQFVIGTTGGSVTIAVGADGSVYVATKKGTRQLL